MDQGIKRGQWLLDRYAELLSQATEMGLDTGPCEPVHPTAASWVFEAEIDRLECLIGGIPYFSCRVVA